MRFHLEKDGRTLLLRCWSSNYREGEIAYVVIGLRGIRADIEFPSDWHEHRRAWIRLGFGLFSINFSFPWRTVVPDDGQCSGPTYGFYYFANALVLEYGKNTGSLSKKKFIYMPWDWTHIRHDYLNPDGSLHHRAQAHKYEEVPMLTTESFLYTYRLASGELQKRIATVNGEEREWRWRGFQWLPWPRKIQRTINVEFNDEVGERTGSWKGGTIECSWEWRHGETMKDALDRMERERRFT